MRVPEVQRQEAFGKFREGRYFEAQEAFHWLWRRARRADKDLYRGWVLLAAALFHRDRGNAKGARACFERARTRWRGLPDEGDDRDLSEILRSVETVLGTEWAAPRFGSGGDEETATETQEDA